MSLLYTKLNIPPARRQAVPRQHLLDRLTLYPEIALVLVSAPAGFGKTTLLAEWCRSLADQPAAQGEDRVGVGWISLDASDNDPARFLAYLIEAVSRAVGEVVDLRPARDALVQNAPSGSTEPCLDLVLNAMEKAGMRCLLVLDDYHFIHAPVVQSAVAYLIDHRPVGLHLAIGSRSTPPLPLARLRARGELVELRAADLRFSMEEAARFLAQSAGLTLDSNQAKVIQQRCEGWAAGLQLAALTLRGQADPAEGVRAFTSRQRLVLDFLMDEVFSQQPSEIQQFLLKTSVLERLCAGLCEAVTNVGMLEPSKVPTFQRSNEILEYLENSNLFTLPLDSEGEWFRYHPLFAEMLQARLQRTSPAMLGTAHIGAANWFAAHGYAAEAVKHSLAAQDVNQAAQIMEQSTDRLLAQGETATLESWMEQLPGEELNRRPILLAAQGWILAASGKLEALEPLLADLETQVEPTGLLAGEIAAIRAFTSLPQRDPALTIRFAEQASACLPEEALFWRGIVARILAEVYLWAGNLDAAMQAVDQCSRISLASGNLSLGFSALNNLAGLYSAQGRLDQAASVFQHALQEASTNGWDSHPYAALLHAGYSGVLLEWNRVEESETELGHAQELASRAGIRDLQANVKLALARHLAAQRRLQEAIRLLNEVEGVMLAQGFPQGAPGSLSPLAALKAWFAHECGEVRPAEAWAADAGLAPDDPRVEGRPQDALTAALIWGAKGLRTHDMCLLAQVAGLLEGLLAIMQRMGGISGQILTQAALATVLDGQGRRDSALSQMESALDLAQPGGFIRSFVDLGLPLEDLLEGVIHRAPGSRRAVYAARIRDVLNAPSAAPFTTIPAAMQSEQPAEKLSQRELEILRLVGQGASNQEIADRLFISLATVKSHINHIMGKLSAQNRTEAVVRARRLGWL